MQWAIAIGQLQVGRRDNDVTQIFGVDVRTIGGLLLWYQQTNDVKDRHRSGLQWITSRQDDIFIQLTVLRNRFHHINWIEYCFAKCKKPGQMPSEQWYQSQKAPRMWHMSKTSCCETKVKHQHTKWQDCNGHELMQHGVWPSGEISSSQTRWDCAFVILIVIEECGTSVVKSIIIIYM